MRFCTDEQGRESTASHTFGGCMWSLECSKGYAVGDLDGQTDGGHGPSVVYSTPAYLFVHELKRADVHPPRQVVAPSSV